MKRRYFALLATLAAAPTLAQSGSDAQGALERVSATYQVVSPGEPLGNDAERSELNVEPLEAPERTEAPARSDDRQSHRMSGAVATQACTNLMAEIDRKIQANNVPDYTLEALPTQQAQAAVARGQGEPGKVEIVGNCGDGAYRIVYRRP
jgi:hypothetical protein